MGQATRLGAFEGISGSVQLSASAERFGEHDAGFAVVNMRQQEESVPSGSDEQPRRQRRQRRLAVPISTLYAEWASTGIAYPYNLSIGPGAAQGIQFYQDRSFDLRPSDGTLHHNMREGLAVLTHESAGLFAMTLLLLLLVLLCAVNYICVFISRRRIRAEAYEQARVLEAENVRLYNQNMQIFNSQGSSGSGDEGGEEGGGREEELSAEPGDATRGQEARDEEKHAAAAAQKECGLEFDAGVTTFWLVDAEKLKTVLETRPGGGGGAAAAPTAAHGTDTQPDGGATPASLDEQAKGSAETTRHLPRFQELSTWEAGGWLHAVKVTALDVFLKNEAIGRRVADGVPVTWHEVLTVSHCWEQPEEPDPTGAQLRHILKHLTEQDRRSGPKIKYVWFDYWCARHHHQTSLSHLPSTISSPLSRDSRDSRGLWLPARPTAALVLL